MESAVQNVAFPSNGSQAHGYLQMPASGSGPGVIVIQEWWGLTSHIADVTTRLAGAGFTALAPDLYGGRTAHDPTEAKQLMQAMPPGEAARDLVGAVAFLLDNPAVSSSTVGVIGFCMGGSFVLNLAAQQGSRISAAVPFYGLPSTSPDYSTLTAAVQGHFGTLDQSIPSESVDAAFTDIRKHSKAAEVEVFNYDAGHAFFNDENLIGTYNPELAALAWGRTTAFLRKHVV
jgi:carboxymethylenebutenolidase